MEYITIDKTTKKAYYLQIADSIRSAILSGRLKDMDKLPTEKELCSFFGISDIVVKQAYGELVEHKLVQRIQGSGSFVSLRKSFMFPISVPKNTSNTRYITSLEYKRILLFETQKKSASINKTLLIDNNQILYKAKYIVYIDKTPVSVQTLYLPKNDYPHLNLLMIMNNTTLELIENHFKYTIDNTKHVFYPVVLHSTEASLLNVPKNSAAHLVRTTLFANQRPIAYLETLLPGLYTQFEVRI